MSTRDVKITIDYKGITSSATGGEKQGKAQQIADKSALAIAATVAVNVAKQEASNMVGFSDYMIQRHLSLTDDYIGQRNYTTAKNIISKGGGIAMAIGSGAMTGGIVGALVAAAVSSINLGLDIYKAYSEQQITLQKMDQQLQFNRVRAGYSLMAGSIGEDK